VCFWATFPAAVRVLSCILICDALAVKRHWLTVEVIATPAIGAFIVQTRQSPVTMATVSAYYHDVLLASCLIYARALLEFLIFILWVRSFSKMLQSLKFSEDKVLIFLILREKC